jgi:dipeptidyl aminopeptidase/acylaminoacyl peptidase
VILGIALFAAHQPVWAASAPTPTAAKISAADFAALPMMVKPKLSPNGHRIAARTTANGVTSLVVIDADNPDKVLRRLSLGTLSAYAVTWAGDNRLLVTVLMKDKVFGEEIPYLRLLSVDVNSGSILGLDTKSRGVYTGDVLYADPTGSWAIVASQDDIYSYPSVKRVDLATGKAELIERAKDEVWDWYADDAGIVRAGVASNGNRWTVWYRDKPGEKLRALKGKFDKNDDGTVDKFIFRGGQSWILTNERTGRFGLYKYDTATAAIGDAIFEHPEVDVDDVLYDSATGKIRAIEFEDDRQRVQWLDPEIKQLQAKIDRALPKAVNLPTDWSNNDQRVLVWSYSGSDPGLYFLLDRQSAKMSPVISPYPQIDAAALSEVRDVKYRTRDGLELHAYLTLPRGKPAEKLPLVLMPHGGPFERDHWEYDPIVQFIASRGYAVLQPQFRGSTGYGKQLVEKGYGEWGRRMQDDLDDSVDWFARTGQIDAKRVCVVGGSYGGYAAMWAAIRNPDRYRCAASIAGVSDLTALLKHDKQLFSAKRYYREWRTKVGGVGNVDLKAVSPLNFAGQIKVPMLIGHGEKDERVPSRQSHDMVDAMTRAQLNVSSVFYKNSGHGFDNAADLEDWLKRLEAFLDKNNPA